MAYNYDPDMLVRHAETVEGLIELAKSGGTSQLTFDTPQDCRTGQQLLNNLMACMVLYDPDNGRPVREALRTWIKYEQERWHLYVGKPSHRIRGGKPLTLHAKPTFQFHTTMRTVPEYVTEVRFDRLIKGEDDWFKFQLMVGAVAAHVTLVRAEFLHPITRIEVFDIFEDWEVQMSSPTSIILRRKDGPVVE